jgi:dolichyl-phosphate beta-glucosyltransferase
LDSLSIVIPAYNEESRLPKTFDRILEWMHEQHFKFQEIIVVDDGSRDATAGVVNDYSKPPSPIRLLRNPGNRGKGYAVRHGVLDAGGEWILYTDADLSTPIAEVQKLYSAAIVQKAVIAIGSRAIDRSLVEVHQSVFREYSGRFFNLVMRTLYRADAAKEIFPRQEQDGFSFDVEDLVIAKKLGLRAVEVPVRWRNVEGTKVTLVEGLRSFTDLLQIRKDHGP